MRHRLSAEEFLRTAAHRAGLEFESVARAFAPAPLGFVVVITDSLPWMVHRFGMQGVTWLGRVYLRQSVIGRSPLEQMKLLRHEAEHVLQQRESPVLFYLKYVGGWILNIAGLLRFGDDSRGRRAGGIATRARRAYLQLPEEIAARNAADRFVRELDGTSATFQ